MWYIYTVEYFLALEKNKILSFVATWVGIENIMLSEYVRERHILYDITYLYSLKININEYICKTETDSQI